MASDWVNQILQL